MKTDRLADAPFDAIAYDRFADRAREGKPDPGTEGLGFTHAKCGEQGTREADPLVVHPSKILRSENADTFRKAWD